MQKITISANDAGQRLDKFLKKYLDAAPGSFLYKMLRKKNITLNGKKAAGNEKLVLGDEVCFWLSDETIDKFREKKAADRWLLSQGGHAKADSPVILYEDAQILIMNKAAGELSQKAKEDDVSINERMIAYLLSSGQLSKEDLQRFRPSICNRLDRNTSGLITAGKTLNGLQFLSEAFRDRSIHKYYLCPVWGSVKEEMHISAYLTKDERSNTVTISSKARHQADRIETAYKPLGSMEIGVGDAREIVTLLEVLLITGRTHQIRAHLAQIGHPILGDPKYGDLAKNVYLRRKLGIHRQLLHAVRLQMPQRISEDAWPGMQYLENRTFTAPLPDDFSLFRRIIGE